MKRTILSLALAGVLGAPAAAHAQTEPAPPVKAKLTATQKDGTVTFDASGSTGGVDYRWNLDSDGTFEVDSGSRPTTSAAYPSGATVTAVVKVTGADGASDQATASITLKQATKQAGVHQQSVAGEDDAPAATTPPKVVAAAASGVTIKDFQFGPKTVTINAGDTVTWTNQGPTGHSTTAKGGQWDSGVLDKGKSFSHTFSQAGTFQYFCKPHPFMTATIVVKGAASSSPSSGSGASGSSGSSGGSGSTSTTTTPATPAATTNPNDLPNTGGDPLPWLALGASLLALGAALRWRLRSDPE
jgi:plastocyanin